MRKVQGKKIRTFELPPLGYVENLKVILNDQESLQKASNLLNSTLNRYQLALNLNKGNTATPILTPQKLQNYPKLIVNIQGVRIENVASFALLE